MMKVNTAVIFIHAETIMEETMTRTLKERSDIDRKYIWDLESMYPSEDLWEADLKKAAAAAAGLAAMAGHLADSGVSLLKAFRGQDELSQLLEKAYTYAHMRRDEDNRVEKYQAMTDRAMSAIAAASAQISYMTPELMEAGEERIYACMDEEPALEIYRHAVENMFRSKEHILTGPEENILAQMSEITSATNDIFTMLNNADIDFGEIKNEKGETVRLTHGNYINFMESHDRSLRMTAFEKMYSAYRTLLNTIGTSYNYNTKTDVVSARIRKYGSAREAALSGDNIPVSVYDNLVDSVNRNLPVLHKYLETRKRLLGNDELKMYDVYVPLIELPEKAVPYEEAQEIIKKALAPLGEEYVRRMSAGWNDGWVDVYENPGKTSGAYSFGCYDSKPFMLLNYTDTLKDVFTLVHETGHSMHSSYTRETQPFVYGSHSIFTAEVASTVNENLLMKYLLSSERDPEMKKYLINMHIEEFRTTLFRQTMFSEFEQWSHAAVEAGENLTAASMSEKYNELNDKYFGPALSGDEYIRYEWARIPHFYNAFYVYKYATGYSAAAAISDIILEKGPDDYLRFLRTGECDYPIELLRIAGVDMDTRGPVDRAMETFKTLVEEFDELV